LSTCLQDFLENINPDVFIEEDAVELAKLVHNSINLFLKLFYGINEELDGPVVCALRRSRKLSNVGHWIGDRNLLSQAPPCSGRQVKPLVRLHLQSLAPTNPQWVRVVGYGPFPLFVIHEEGPSSGNINWLMMNGINLVNYFRLVLTFTSWD
jgi:hypothetical protein